MNLNRLFKGNLNWKKMCLLLIFMTQQASAMIENEILKESESLKNCTGSSENCFQQIKNNFQSYQRQGRQDAFLYSSQQKKVKKAALLIHSYTMNPREMNSFARYLASKDYNIIGINLEAHNGRSNFVTMKQVSGKDWEKDVQYGLNMAHALGDEVIIVGYSLGGLLATQAALKHPDEIKGIALIAPSLALRRAAETFACLGRQVSSNSFFGGLAQKIKGSQLSDYEKSFLDGACAIKEILTDIFPLPQNNFNNEMPQRDWRDPMLEKLSEIKMPVYISLTESDEILDVTTIRYITKEIPKLYQTYYPSSHQVGHLSIIRLLQLNESNGYSYYNNLPKMNNDFDHFLSATEH